MDFERRIPHALDAEHRASLQLLERLERALTKGSSDAELAALAPQLLHLMDDEVVRHFAFEEDALFPRLHDAGDGDIAAMLSEEHADIRSVCAELRPLVQVLGGAAPSPEQRGAIVRLGLELVERMVMHIQKETMGLLPLLEDLLDEQADRELALAYAGA